jgi:hypothetical protein
MTKKAAAQAHAQATAAAATAAKKAPTWIPYPKEEKLMQAMGLDVPTRGRVDRARQEQAGSGQAQGRQEKVSEEAVAGLVRAIDWGEDIHSPVVWDLGDKHVVLSGHTRDEACERTGVTWYDAYIFPPDSDPAKMRLFAETANSRNESRESVSWLASKALDYQQEFPNTYSLDDLSFFYQVPKAALQEAVREREIRKIVAGLCPEAVDLDKSLVLRLAVIRNEHPVLGDVAAAAVKYDMTYDQAVGLLTDIGRCKSEEDKRVQVAKWCEAQEKKKAVTTPSRTKQRADHPYRRQLLGKLADLWRKIENTADANEAGVTNSAEKEEFREISVKICTKLTQLFIP